MFENITPWATDGGYIRLAQPRGRLDQRIEHRLQIERRAADDLEYVGGGGLLLQRFPQLVEQPDILDGNHSLVGEVLDKLDLPVTERAHLLAVNANDANHCIFLEQRDYEHGSHARFHSNGP